MRDLKIIMIIVWIAILTIGFGIALAQLIEFNSINKLRGGIILLIVGAPTIVSLIDGVKNK